MARILIVDDEVDLAEMIQLLLQSRGYEVELAHNGREGLSKVQEFQPDLILLDVMMPVLDGFQVCRMLKFDDKFKHIQVIMLTARTQAKDQDLGQKVGADGYVTKPFDNKDLLAKIEEHLQTAGVMQQGSPA